MTPPVSPGGPAAAVAPAAVGDGAVVAWGAAQLLPSPTASATSVEDLYAMMAEMSDAQSEFGKAKAEQAATQRKHQLEAYKAALQRQREAEEGGLLSKLGVDELAKVATVAVAIAAVAVTGGASLVVAGVLLSAAGMAVSETKCFGEASKWVGLGLSVGGGVMTGFGVAAHAAAAANTACAARAGTVLDIATGVSAGSQAAVGAKNIEAACYEHDADEARIEQKQAQNQMARLDRMIDEVIDEMKDAKKSKQRSSERLSEINETEGQTLLIAAGAGVRA